VYTAQAHPALDRLGLRGPYVAQDEFLFAVAIQNLRKLEKQIALPAQTAGPLNATDPGRKLAAGS
jgi:hypothetical protein